MCEPIRWHGWSDVQHLYDLLFEIFYSSWLVGWWADFEDPPQDLQSMGWQGVTWMDGMVGQLVKPYVTFF